MSILGHDYYYHGQMRKYILYFGTIFNEIEIERTTGDASVQKMRIPILYGPRDKMLARYDADPDIQRAAALATPRLSYEMRGMSYDGERKLPALSRMVRKDTTDLNKARSVFTHVPYNINFELNVMAKTAEDCAKIVEQIFPFFTPDFTATVNLIPDMNIAPDIPIILNGASWEDSYDGDMTERRSIIWRLEFTMKAMFYGPVKSKPIIKFVDTNLYVGNTSSNTVVSTTRYQPGLTANGVATSNADNSIAVANIAIDDAYGYVANTVI